MRNLILLTILAASAAAARPAASTSQLPYTFEKNEGQLDPTVRYIARGPGYALFLTGDEAVLRMIRRGKPNKPLRMSLLGGQPPAAVEAIEPMATRSNYFIGDSARWKQDVPHYGKVRYRSVYPGVDLVYYGNGGQLEYDFVLAPGASSETIAMNFKGANRISAGPSGALRIAVDGETITQRSPVAYQVIDGVRKEIAVSYAMRGAATVGFRVADYDRTQPLVIDPVLVYSTYFGGNRTDEVTGIAVDHEGNTYITGETTSLDIPLVGPDVSKPDASVNSFVTKINAAGTAVIYSSYLGGNGNTRANAIAVDAEGNVYLTGRTGSRNFPLANPVQSEHKGLNICFVSKLNPAGNKLLFSTLLGGERNDEPNALALDASGNIYIAGIANSTEFPTMNALFPKQQGGGDSFVAKFQAPDYRLAYSTYFGGTGLDEVWGLAVDSSESVYMTGILTSPNMGTKGVYQPKPNGWDSFLVKLTPAADAISFFTYLGGNNTDRGHALAVDAAGNIWVAGSTSSKNFPVTADAVQSTLKGDWDVFASKFDPNGETLLYSTLLGGTATGGGYNEDATAVKIDAAGNIYLSGVMVSPDFPSVRPLQPFGGGTQDAFLTKLNPAAGRIVFSTPYGGSGNDSGDALALDATGSAYIAGLTGSADLPIKAGVRSKMTGSNDGFLAKICDPEFYAAPGELVFTYTRGEIAPALQTLNVSTCAPIPFQVEADGAFLAATPGSGVTNAQADVRVTPGDLESGEYKAVLRFTSADAANSPYEVPVLLRVLPESPAITGGSNGNAESGEPGGL